MDYDTIVLCHYLCVPADLSANPPQGHAFHNEFQKALLNVPVLKWPGLGLISQRCRTSEAKRLQ